MEIQKTCTWNANLYSIYNTCRQAPRIFETVTSYLFITYLAILTKTIITKNKRRLTYCAITCITLLTVQIKVITCFANGLIYKRRKISNVTSATLNTIILVCTAKAVADRNTTQLANDRRIKWRKIL